MAKSKDRFKDKRQKKNNKSKVKIIKQDKLAEDSLSKQVKNNHSNKLIDFYDKNYKKLLIIPFVILFVAIAQIGFQFYTTGDFVNKGVSLKGGITITAPIESNFNSLELANSIKSSLSEYEIAGNKQISVKGLSGIGGSSGVIIEADIILEGDIDKFINLVSTELNVSQNDLNVDIIGPSLGESFFKQTIIAIVIAFIFMGIVVFLYFRSFAPSVAVILAALSDIIVTLAVVNVLGMKLSTAGVAAFLMLIGYSIDTDILLSTKVLKRKDEGEILERIMDAMKTGMTMTATTMVALIVGIIGSKSQVLDQIMIIVLIGLVIDIINTWIQNVGILRLYLERKGEGQ